MSKNITFTDCLENLKSVFNSALDGIWGIDRLGNIIFYNEAFKKFINDTYGLEIQDGDNIEKFFQGNRGLKLKKIWQKSLNGISLKRVFALQLPNKNILYILFKIFPLRNQSGEILGSVIIGRNITKERRKEKLLKHNLSEQYLINEVFKSLFNPKDFNDAIMKVLDMIGIHTKMSAIYVYQDYYDERYSHLTYEWYDSKLKSKEFPKEFNYDDFYGFKEYLVENNILIYNKFNEYSDTITDFFTRMGAKSAVIFPMMIKGKYIGFIVFQENKEDRLLTVSEIDILRIFASILGNALIQKYTEEKLTYASTHDPLTGLYNRAYFDAEIERLINSRNFPISVIMADLNGLKQINDTLGHKEGDELIIKAAKVLTKIFRKEDCVARIGGDEFAILLTKTDEEKMNEVIARIRVVEQEINSDEQIKVSLAIGGATAFSKDELQKAMLLADERMYIDKKRIKNIN
ncbi:MAG: diguanylate cyclase [Deferribacterales bacterium]